MIHHYAYIYALSLLCFLGLQNFVQGEFNHEITDNILLKESFLCDNTHMETQLETLKLQMEIMQEQLNKQTDILNRLDKKIDEIPRQMQAMQEKLLQDNKFNFEDLKYSLHKQIQNEVRAAAQPQVDDKTFILKDIKEILKDHDKALDNILSNQNNTEKLLREAIISNKLAILEKVDGKLVNIENDAMTKTEQLKFRCDIQRYLDKNEVTKNTCKGDYLNLFCNSASYPTNCADFNESHCISNKCCISNEIYGSAAFLVSCNNKEEGGGWTVIQRRMDGSVDFYRNWSEYKNGFGDVNGEFFIGLDKLHTLTTTLKPMELLIQLEDFNNTKKYAKYDDFQVANETENYKLIKLGSFNGNAGDSLRIHEGYGFTTIDRDNDLADRYNCAVRFSGGWWYRKCYNSNLNGKYFKDGDKSISRNGIAWNAFRGDEYSLKFVQMMIRPKGV